MIAVLTKSLRRSAATGFVLPLSGGADSAVTGTIVFNMCKLMAESYRKEKIGISNKNVLEMINSIKTEPLYRIYARYPIDKETGKETGKVWFDGLPKIVTNLPIKYIIPNNYKKGVIMITYTDSKFAKYWFKQVANGTFETTLTKQLKILFPDKNIPKAKWYKHCPWIMGAGYWKKGSNREDIMPVLVMPE